MNANRDQKDCLLKIIDAGINSRTYPLDISSKDAKLYKQIACKQNILPVLWNGFRITNSFNAYEELVEPELSKIRYQFILRDHSLTQIKEALNKADIPYIPLKGSVIRDLYPEPWFRTCNDIDVLVPEERLDEAVKTLEDNTDFKYWKKSYHDVSMLNSDVHLELHFSVRVHMNDSNELLDRVWDYSKPSGEGSCYVMSPEFLMFHVVAHMARHLINGGLGFRPYIDLWLLKTKTEFDEAELRSMLASCNLLQFYENSCHLVDVWFAGAEHTDTTRKLEDLCFQGGVFGNSQIQTSANYRNFKGISYLVRRFFYPINDLKDSNYSDGGNSRLVSSAQLKRWKTLLERDTQKRILQEIKTTFSRDEKEVDEFAGLMKDLGL